MYEISKTKASISAPALSNITMRMSKIPIGEFFIGKIGIIGLPELFYKPCYERIVSLTHVSIHYVDVYDAEIIGYKEVVPEIDCYE